MRCRMKEGIRRLQSGFVQAKWQCKARKPEENDNNKNNTKQNKRKQTSTSKAKTYRKRVVQ